MCIYINSRNQTKVVLCENIYNPKMFYVTQYKIQVIAKQIRFNVIFLRDHTSIVCAKKQYLFVLYLLKSSKMDMPA